MTPPQRQQPQLGHGEPGHPGGDREQGEPWERDRPLLPGRLDAEPHQRRDDPAEGRRVGEQEDHADHRRAQQRPDDSTQHADQHPGRAVCGPARHREIDAGAQHRGPQRQERAGHSDPHEPQDVEDLVSQQQPALPGLPGLEGEQRPEHGTERQQGCGGDVGLHGEDESRCERGLDLQTQRDRVPDERGGDHQRAQQHQPWPGGEHAGDGHHDARGQQADSRDLSGAGLVPETGLQQSLGEVLTPHHDRGGDQTEGHHVHHEPARLGDPGVDEDHHDQREHPPGDWSGGPAMPGPTARGGALRTCGGGGGGGELRHFSRLRPGTVPWRGGGPWTPSGWCAPPGPPSVLGRVLLRLRL